MLRRRGKKGIIVAIAFASLALTSVGFSTWIASYQTITEVESNVTVGVADAITGGLEITAGLVEGETGFLFDAAPNDTDGPIVNSGPTCEDLTVAFNVTLSGENAEIAFNGLSIIAEAADEETRAETTSLFNTYSASGENQYFTSPFKLGEEKVILFKTKDQLSNDIPEDLEPGILIKEEAEETNDPNKITFKVIITLGWGSYFGNQNPSLTNDSTKVPDYFNGLRELKALYDRKIEFTVKHPGTPFTSQS